MTIDLSPLEALRKEQDAIDRELMVAIAKRYNVRQKISAFRRENNLPTVDPDRMKYVLQQAEGYAVEMGVPAEMARHIYGVLIGWSHDLDRQWRKEA
jgi:4-amino-4-deoxychorismate mutase